MPQVTLDDLREDLNRQYPPLDPGSPLCASGEHALEEVMQGADAEYKRHGFISRCPRCGYLLEEVHTEHGPPEINESPQNGREL